MCLHKSPFFLDQVFSKRLIFNADDSPCPIVHTLCKQSELQIGLKGFGSCISILTIYRQVFIHVPFFFASSLLLALSSTFRTLSASPLKQLETLPPRVITALTEDSKTSLPLSIIYPAQHAASTEVRQLGRLGPASLFLPLLSYTLRTSHPRFSSATSLPA